MSQFYTPSEAAELFAVSTKTVARWAEEGKIRVVVTPGGHRRYPKADLDAILVPVAEPEESLI